MIIIVRLMIIIHQHVIDDDHHRVMDDNHHHAINDHYHGDIFHWFEEQSNIKDCSTIQRDINVLGSSERRLW